MREKYESLSAVVLRDLAKARGLKNISGMKKSDLVDLMVAEDERQSKEENTKRVSRHRSESRHRSVSRRSGNRHRSESRRSSGRRGSQEREGRTRRRAVQWMRRSRIWTAELWQTVF